MKTMKEYIDELSRLKEELLKAQEHIPEVGETSILREVYGAGISSYQKAIDLSEELMAIDYTSVIEYLKNCFWLIDKANQIKSETPLEDSEEPLVSVWNMHDLIRAGLGTDYEMVCKLEDNIKTLAKAELLRDIKERVCLAEKDRVRNLEVGKEIKVANNDKVKVLAFTPDPEDPTLEAKELGTVFCSRNDCLTKFVVWRYRIEKDDTLKLYSGEYFRTKEMAKEYYNSICINK